MAGASEQTVRAERLGASRSSRAGDGAGFELLMVAEDGEETAIVATVLGQGITPGWSSRSRRA